MNRSLSVLLVDDEPLARLHLRRLLEEHGGVTIAGEAGCVTEAATLAKSCRPDLIFLDIDLPPHTGFDLLPALDSPQKIVFVTAFDEFAVRAFEINSLDYLLKPVSAARLRETLRRCELAPSSVMSPPSCVQRLLIDDQVVLRDRQRMKLAPVRQITAIKAEGTYTRVFLAEGDSLIVLKPIGEWEFCLPGPPFMRLDRSLLINCDAVTDLHVYGRDDMRVTLKGVTEVFVLGRTASSRLRSTMAGR
jgi:two-component system LytT family response regulator